MPVSGFEWFVAWRHLRDPERRSRRMLVAGLILCALGIAAHVVSHVLASRGVGRGFLPFRVQPWVGQVQLGGSVAFALGLVITYLGVLLRAFTVFTAISVFGVFLGTAAPIIALSVMSGFELDLKAKIRNTKADVVITGLEGEPITGWRQTLAAATTVPGVVAAMPYIESEVLLKSNSFSGALLRGIDPETAGRVLELGPAEALLPDLAHPERVAEEAAKRWVSDSAPPESPGDEPEKAAPERQRLETLPTILMGGELYEKLMHVFVGGELTVVCPECGTSPTGPVAKPKRFRVAGYFKTGMYEYDAKIVYVALPVAQKYLGMDGGEAGQKADEVTGLDIRTVDPDRADEVVMALKARLGAGFEVRSWQELNKSLFSALRLEKIAMFIVLTFIALVASFSIVSNLIMLVTQKGREVAILKAMGAADRAILRVFFAEGLYIGVLGLAAGVTTGVVACALMTKYGLPLPSEIYYMDRLPVVMRTGEIATVAALALLLCCLATIYPAILASRMKPVEGLRYE